MVNAVREAYQPTTARRSWRARKAPRSPLDHCGALGAFLVQSFRGIRGQGRGVRLAGTLENEAIRPHVGGRFVELLTAVEQHPP